MTASRYKQARTLVRRLCRLPGEDRQEFKGKVARLRQHFERFNLDCSELCQWLMGLRKRHAQPDKPGSFGALGDFLLEPQLDGVEADEKEADRWRLAVFDDVAGLRAAGELGGEAIPAALRQAMDEAAAGPRTRVFEGLLERLRPLEPAHRLVLLKSAAEWIVARYRRGADNWERHYKAWADEKAEWESRHPELTEAVRQRFTDVFKLLVWDEAKKPGVRKKNPRICPLARIEEGLREKKDNCIYAGQRGHDPLCWEYDKFVKAQNSQDGTQKDTGNARKKAFNDKHFWENASKFVASLARYAKASKGSKHAAASPHQRALEELFAVSGKLGQREAKARRDRFKAEWKAYLDAMGLSEQKLIEHGQLPHCQKIGGTCEESKCRWNRHTELCQQYRRRVTQLDAQTLKLEPLYRAWRKLYLAPPRKPSLRYPGARKLPMPKVFGEGWHEADFERSVLRLRLDDMPRGEWLELGFVPWPRKYNPSRAEVKDRATSVQVNFVGTRARVGFRFDVAHAPSRFACTQDELDWLRSREFPRLAQDRQFLEAARKRLLESFDGGAERELRILAVDLGEHGAHAAVYQGRDYQSAMALEIVKIDALYEALPAVLKKDQQLVPPPKFDAQNDPRGLRKEHVKRHLERIANRAEMLAEHRPPQGSAPPTLADSDFRGVKRHVAWMIRDWARHNAARIVATAERHGCHLVVLESLRGFLAPGYDQMDPDKKRRLAMFSFGRIRRKVAEKAVERGLRVVTVPYLKSSQFCSACGHEQQDKGRWRHNKKERKFNCECGDPKAKKERKISEGAAGAPEASSAAACSCKEQFNSDENAARVLARVFWGEITLPEREDE